MHPDRAVIATIPTESENERIIVTLRQDDAATILELCQQSWGEGLGWFTQSAIKLQPAQVAALRAALGTAGQGSAKTSRRLAQGLAQMTDHRYCVVAADSA